MIAPGLQVKHAGGECWPEDSKSEVRFNVPGTCTLSYILRVTMCRMRPECAPHSANPDGLPNHNRTFAEDFKKSLRCADVPRFHWEALFSE